MYKRLLLIFFLIAGLVKGLSAQTNNDRIEFTAINGICVFTPDNNSIEGKTWGGELAWHFNMSNDTAAYIRMLGISDIDIVASYRSLQALTINHDPASKGSLGSVFSTIGRLEIPVVKAGPVKLLFTPGFGFAYSTINYFDNKNPFVGSHLNLAAQAGLKLFTALSQSTGIQAGIDLFHYSNVGARVPNFGINSYNLSLGLVQNIEQKGPSTPQQPFTFGNRSAIEFGGDVGERGVYESKKELHRAGFYAGYSYQLSPVISLKGGFDAGYYFTPFDPKNFNATFAEYGSSYDKWRYGISIGGDLMLGRLAVMAAYGYYLHYHSYYNNKTYWTPGLKYYVLPWMAIQAKAYIHNTDADYLGVGLLFRMHP